MQAVIGSVKAEPRPPVLLQIRITPLLTLATNSNKPTLVMDVKGQNCSQVLMTLYGISQSRVQSLLFNSGQSTPRRLRCRQRQLGTCAGAEVAGTKAKAPAAARPLPAGRGLPLLPELPPRRRYADLGTSSPAAAMAYARRHSPIAAPAHQGTSVTVARIQWHLSRQNPAGCGRYPPQALSRHRLAPVGQHATRERLTIAQLPQ